MALLDATCIDLPASSGAHAGQRRWRDIGWFGMWETGAEGRKTVENLERLAGRAGDLRTFGLGSLEVPSLSPQIGDLLFSPLGPLVSAIVYSTLLQEGALQFCGFFRTFFFFSEYATLNLSDIF